MLFELGLVAAVSLLALFFPRLGESAFRKVESTLARCAARKGLAIGASFLLAIALRLAVLPIEPIPTPAVHDEFSYLLMADTFAHGRLTNPTPAVWQHFETFHENMRPTYCSKFFPAQGVLLAAGQVVVGHPFWGIVLSLGLMAAATCWSMQGWMPPAWALLGALLVTAHFGVFGYWANSYWGGTVAACGGALVIGALPRLKRQPKKNDAIVLAIGLMVLANSRPYEGLIFCIPVLVLLMLSWVRKRNWAMITRQVILPVAAMIACAAASMGYYFWRTTGKPYLPPYAVYSATYDSVPFVPWRALHPIPSYNNGAMRRFYLGFVQYQYLLYRNTPLPSIIGRVFNLWWFFVGFLLTVPFLAVCFVLPYGMRFKDFSIKTREIFLVTTVGVISVTPIVFFGQHYAAPATCAVYILIMYCMRRIWVWKRHHNSRGRSIIRGLVLASIFLVLGHVAALCFRLSPMWISTEAASELEAARPQVLSSLQNLDGTHLVLVRYSSDHNPHEEWVYNGAALENARVIWARELDPSSNQQLIKHFKDRRVWLLQPDKIPPKLESYEVSAREP